MTARRIARLVHRGSGQVAREHDLTDLTPAEVDQWYLGLVKGQYFTDFRIEWPTSDPDFALSKHSHSTSNETATDTVLPPNGATS